MAKWLVTAAFILGLASGTLAQEPSCVIPRRDLVSPQVQAVVSAGVAGYNYQYVVTNKTDAQQSLVMIAVEAFTVPPPISTSPPDWKAAGPIVGSSSFLWGTVVESGGLAPGVSASGFGFASPAPPTVVGFLAWGAVELPSFPADQAPESCAGSDAFQNSFKGVTVGPKTPPQPFVAIESLNHLIALLHESLRIGWIIRAGVHDSMLTKLTTAKRRLEANDPAGANSSLKAFLAEVTGASCEDFECHGNLPATSEAYALLYFNGKYISDPLP